MREILFRGKATWDGRWLYGEFVNNPEPRVVTHSRFANKESIRQLSVDLATVGQYIGGWTDYSCDKHCLGSGASEILPGL